MKVFYKKILKAFGGAALYLNKDILSYLKVSTGDEVKIELRNNQVIITKPLLDSESISKILQNDR